MVNSTWLYFTEGKKNWNCAFMVLTFVYFNPSWWYVRRKKHL